MKKIIGYAALGVLLTFGSAVSARANTVNYLFTAGQLLSSGITLGGTCANSLSQCGVLGLGLTGITGLSGGVTIGSISIIAPALGPTDAWSGYSGSELSSTGSPAVLTGSGMEEGGTTITFITADTRVSSSMKYCDDNTAQGNKACGAGTYAGAAAGGTGLSQAATLSSTDQLGFQVTFNGTQTGTVTLNLEIVADEFNTDGSQNGSTTYGGQAAITGVSGQATPEPSSLLLIAAGIAGIAVSRIRPGRFRSRAC